MPCLKFLGTICMGMTFLFSLVGRSQPLPPRPQFDVASVKQNKENRGGSLFGLLAGLRLPTLTLIGYSKWHFRHSSLTCLG